jgi:hypothetical protein
MVPLAAGVLQQLVPSVAVQVIIGHRCVVVGLHVMR